MDGIKQEKHQNVFYNSLDLHILGISVWLSQYPYLLKGNVDVVPLDKLLKFITGPLLHFRVKFYLKVYL